MKLKDAMIQACIKQGDMGMAKIIAKNPRIYLDGKGTPVKIHNKLKREQILTGDSMS